MKHQSPSPEPTIISLRPHSCIKRLPLATAPPYVDYWEPVRTGDWEIDNATGREHARFGLDWCRAHGNSAIFVAVLRDMVRKGRFEGVEAGLLFEIAEQLLRKTKSWIVVVGGALYTAMELDCAHSIAAAVLMG